MNPKNLLLLCALLSTSAVLASQPTTESPKSAADSPQVSPSSSEDSSVSVNPSRRVLLGRLRAAWERLGAEKREAREHRQELLAHLPNPSTIREPKAREVFITPDALSAMKPEEFEALHQTSLERLATAGNDAKISVSWAYHLLLTDRLGEVVDAGLAQKLKDVLQKRRLEIAYTAIFHKQKQATEELYRKLQENESDAFDQYHEEYAKLKKYSRDMRRIHETMAKIRAIFAELSAIEADRRRERQQKQQQGKQA